MNWEPIETMPIDYGKLLYFMVKTEIDGVDNRASWAFVCKIQEEDDGEYIDKYYYMTPTDKIWPYTPTHWLMP